MIINKRIQHNGLYMAFHQKVIDLLNSIDGFEYIDVERDTTIADYSDDDSDMEYYNKYYSDISNYENSSFKYPVYFNILNTFKLLVSPYYNNSNGGNFYVIRLFNGGTDNNYYTNLDIDMSYSMTSGNYPTNKDKFLNCPITNVDIEFNIVTNLLSAFILIRDAKYSLNLLLNSIDYSYKNNIIYAVLGVETSTYKGSFLKIDTNVSLNCYGNGNSYTYEVLSGHSLDGSKMYAENLYSHTIGSITSKPELGKILISDKILCYGGDYKGKIANVYDCSDINPLEIYNIDGNRYYSVNRNTLILIGEED